MYHLVIAQLATMQELKYIYTLDEALKLYALHRMQADVERGRTNELRNSSKK